MNKTAIKNFAIWARNKLIADAQYKAGLLGITATIIKEPLPQSTKETQFFDIGTAEPYAISRTEIKQRASLVDVINQKTSETDYKTAYKYIIEEVAYTWFNRLIAVRFMEVNDYLPSHVRVLSSESGKQEPDLVTTPFDAELPLSDAEKQEIIRLKNTNELDACFRMLFIKQCNALNEILPALFEKTSDYTELLLNISAIDKEGVVYHLVNDIPEADFDVNQGGQVEIIGWLYQYYNTEPKNEAFAKDGKITKEEIPAVTQLFTPDWIVRYMVENSLGRLWVEGHPNDLLKNKWKYYLEEAEQEPEVQRKLDEIHKEYAKLNPEDIHFIDPCMGSGHILVYAFDVLMQIYESAGYSERDAAKSILENNLYGLDIDDRARQMAYFAVMMKARQYNRRILSADTACHVYSIQDSNSINRNQLKYFGLGLNETEKKEALIQLGDLLDTFRDAKEYGSILNVENYNWDLLRRFVEGTDVEGQMAFDSVGLPQTQEKIGLLIDIAEALARKYEAVVTNPPYMVLANGGEKLTSYVNEYYTDSKTDLYAVFIEKCFGFSKRNSLISMITQHSWMFLSSYEKLREKLNLLQLINMAHLGARAFDEIGGEVVQTTSFVYRNDYDKKYVSSFVRLINTQGETNKKELFLSIKSEKNKDVYFAKVDDFKKINGAPIAYWASRNILRIFDNNTTIGDLYKTITGSSTGDNLRFLKLWFEVDVNKIGLSIRADYNGIKYKWIPCNKGGSYRKWFGNNQYVIDWYNDGKELKEFATMKNNGKHWSRFLKSLDCFYREGITWSKVATGEFSARYMPEGFIMESAACAIMPEANEIGYLLALMNCKIVKQVLDIKNPTLNLQTGDVIAVPIVNTINDRGVVQRLSADCVSLTKQEWNTIETSWDFKKHPLIQNIITGEAIADKYKEWEETCDNRFNQLKSNEEELNRIFIDIYGLHGELTPEVKDKDVTVRKADLQRDIKSLLSYAVGCMFGRYSLDVNGLAYAGGEWDANKYTTYIPDTDNILPITDEEYFEDDIVGLLIGWLKKVYGEDTLEKNLDFIAQALGNKGDTSRDIIRNYLVSDFFKEHCQTYSVTGSGKRPIYWLFDSGKQNGFKALIYLHRYNADTIGNLRVDYLHRMQRVYESEIGRMQDMIDHSTNSREVGAATKRKEKLQKQLKECRDYDEKLAHLALARTELDLDDGVKYNYRKVQMGSDGKLYEVLADSNAIMMDEEKFKKFKKQT